MLSEQCPGIKIAIIEKSEKFKRRVGESTVEISSWFLLRALKLGKHLNLEHINKQGLRFWLSNEQCNDYRNCSEIGPKYNVRLPGFQIDRSVLDENLLQKAITKENVTLFRQWKVSDFELQDGGTQTAHLFNPQSLERKKIQGRWIIDASGFNTLIARKNGWYKANKRHATASLWARFKGVKQLDSDEDCCSDFSWRNKAFGMRMPATNHVVGFGWWSWWIPLKDGDYSVGIVFDQNIVSIDTKNRHLGETLKNFLNQHPMSRFMLSDAEIIENDVHYRKNLPYLSQKVAGDGFALVGDAAGFIDPFYSPGLDWSSFTIMNAVNLIKKQRNGLLKKSDITGANSLFTQSGDRWFQALYEGKYYYIGDAELMNLSFKLDLGTYYLGVVDGIYKKGLTGFMYPPFARPYSTPAFLLIRLYNNRLTKIAINRRITGSWGASNNNNYYPFNSYTLSTSSKIRVFFYLLKWLQLEIKEGWRTWLTPKSLLLKRLSKQTTQ